jgi:hypothetical protein
LRDALGDMNPQKVAEMRRLLFAFAARKPKMVKAKLPLASEEQLASPHSVVLPYKAVAKRLSPAKVALRMPRQRQAVAAAR